jgi:hypothetical protein
MATFAVTGWSIKYLVGMSLTHTTGPEIYGVLTAVVAVGAGVASVAVQRRRPASVVAVGAVIAVFALVALAGLGGTIAHVIGPVGGHGPIDPRPRPVAAPLVFTVLGTAGGFAALLANRAARRRARTLPGK